MHDPLALAEHRLAAGELRPALDALKDARAQAFEAGDRDRLERVRALALELRPLLGKGSKADWSCGVLLFAVHESLELLAAEESGRGEGAEPAVERATRGEAGAPARSGARARAPEPEPGRAGAGAPAEPEPAEPEPPPAAEPALALPESQPVIGRSVVQAHVEEAKTTVLEPGERLLGMFHGVVRETREDGGRGRPKGGVVLHDYLLVTDRGVVLWTRGRRGSIERFGVAEITGADAVHVGLGRSIAIELGAARRWFASMRRGDDERAVQLIRELAGQQPVEA